MPRADRPTLAQLRKLAREALGPLAELELYQRWQDPAFYAEVTAPGQSVKGDGVDTWEARRQLRTLLQDLITGQSAGDGCTLHGDAPHGKEAEELRSGIEALLAEHTHVVTVGTLQKLLDRVSARDSLAHLRAKERAPRRRATNGAAYRRKAT